MEQVKEFLEFLFKKEQEAFFAGQIREDFEKYNNLAKEIRSYMDNDSVGLGLPILSNPKPDFLYDDPPFYAAQRHIYKISEYQHERYDRIWACYTSGINPDMVTRRITTCFLVAEINGNLKMIADLGVEPDTKKWTFYGGDEDKSLRLHNLGTPSKVSRYMEPADEEWSLKEFEKNK